MNLATIDTTRSFRPKSEALQLLIDRGFLHQCTDLEALDAKLTAGPITAYAGFDATADSLHVGHLLPLMAMRWLQKTGHRPILLVGGGTTRVGDPSFRSESRPLLDDAQIEHNLAGIRATVERLFDLSEGQGQIINNAEWLDEFRFLEFLRDFGTHFTVNRMMTFDSVRSRLEAQQPLSVLEFCYMMLQAVDFVELNKRVDCTLQIGGSDQWGNIVNGVDLGRRSGNQLFGFTLPLLTTASGSKMGKTAEGAVWLNPSRLSSFGFWQFWRNADDADVPRFLKLFTELPLGEIDRLASLKGPELNEAKKILATQVTGIVHGLAAAEAALQQGEALFGGQEDLSQPTHELPLTLLAKPLGLLELLVQVGFAESNGEARRLIRGGGVRLNSSIVLEEARMISEGDLKPGERLTLAVGKRRKALVMFV
ncbi:Tyrosine--tRNA ligase [Pseudovibrio axinellae]|uniref:Tyrosine--tRNA ligase n=1 Tax=Pseudovibrio axinellae TaxID=989403 RepID=A0A165YEW2_9HYPH|nr:tyrosine--tRNA ligase [Pseudovibrio axinellae]KZL18783.1 Tyrosine--tRNA ligase [Pseudovibrio axinellae]SEP92944.1 tyrosyl-tRNA synthetase [Pseudovibrio axinellae]